MWKSCVTLALCLGFSGVAGLSGCASLSGGRPDLVKAERVLSLSRLGEEYYRQQDLDRAADAFNELIKLDPQFEEALFRLGNIAFLKGDMDAAEDWFERVLAVNSSHSRATYNLAVISLMRAEAFLKQYKSAVRPDADTAEADLMLRYLGDFAQGKLDNRPSGRGELLQKLVEIAEDKPK
jgi:tetratricopeptide (TPR) repeat protein